MKEGGPSEAKSGQWKDRQVLPAPAQGPSLPFASLCPPRGPLPGPNGCPLQGHRQASADARPGLRYADLPGEGAFKALDWMVWDVE